MATPTELPGIETRWTCIATDKQVTLAAIASSCHSEEAVYLPVFVFPTLDFPYTASGDFGRDGYLARVLGDRASSKINNALSRVPPSQILLLGLTAIEQSYLRATLPNQLLIEIDSIEALLKHLPSPPRSDGFVACKQSELIQGLLFAKFERKRLVIDDDAPSLPSKRLHGGDGLVVIEQDGNLNDVAAINYAFAIGADVALVSPVSKQDIRSLPRQLEEWSKDRSHSGYQETRRQVRNRLRGINLQQYNFITFFTRGLPYGLFLNNIVPCSHVLKELDCGAFIANCLSEEHNPTAFDSSIVFSPEIFASDESRSVIKILDDHNYTVTPLLGKYATVKNIANYGGFFPYDVMHICTHGGETDGYFVVQKFVDRQGDAHQLEFYEVVGFAPAEAEHVLVTRKAIFKSLDGYAWMSEPLKAYRDYIFEDMMKAIRNDKDNDVVRVRYDSPIALSCHIQCHGSIHQGEFQSLAGFGSPVVFNNSCASSHELEAQFINAGARAYIGTLWRVGNETATTAAATFYKEIVEHGNLLAAMVAMNASIGNPRYSNIYILWGLHLSSLRMPTKKSDDKIFAALVAEYLMWMKKIATTADADVRRNSIPIAKFVLREISERFSPERLKKVTGYDPEALNRYERGMPVIEDNTARGMTEMVLEGNHMAGE